MLRSQCDMASTMVRVLLETRDVLHNLSQKQKRSVQKVAEAAVETYRRRALLAEANAAYARLDTDDWQGELAGWDGTLSDSLKGE